MSRVSTQGCSSARTRLDKNTPTELWVRGEERHQPVYERRSPSRAPT